MPKAFVTGATGFIGPHLVRLLRQEGWEVTCLVRDPGRAGPLTPLGVNLWEGDLTRPLAPGQWPGPMDVVFHLAGLIKAFRSAEYERVNVGGTRHLLEACARLGTPPVVVVVSSLAAAGPAPNGRARTETDPPVPVSSYGRSKLASEQVARKFAQRLPLTIVRPPIVYGAGDRELFQMFQPIAKLGIHPVPTLANHRYSLVHARDLVRSIVSAAQHGQRIVCTEGVVDPQSNGQQAAQGTYFVAHGEQPTYVELGRLISAALDRPSLRVWRAPQITTWALGLLGEAVGRLRGRPMIINLDKARESQAGSWTCDPSRAAAEIQFRPSVSLEEGLQETARWYRSEGWL